MADWLSVCLSDLKADWLFGWFDCLAWLAISYVCICQGLGESVNFLCVFLLAHVEKAFRLNEIVYFVNDIIIYV